MCGGLEFHYWEGVPKLTKVDYVISAHSLISPLIKIMKHNNDVLYKDRKEQGTKEQIYQILF